MSGGTALANFMQRTVQREGDLNGRGICTLPPLLHQPLSWTHACTASCFVALSLCPRASYCNLATCQFSLKHLCLKCLCHSQRAFVNTCTGRQSGCIPVEGRVADDVIRSAAGRHREGAKFGAGARVAAKTPVAHGQPRAAQPLRALRDGVGRAARRRRERVAGVAGRRGRVAARRMPCARDTRVLLMNSGALVTVQQRHTACRCNLCAFAETRSLMSISGPSAGKQRATAGQPGDSSGGGLQ